MRISGTGVGIVLLSVALCAPLEGRTEQRIDRTISIVARALAEAVTARDAEAVTVLCAVPINLDGEVLRSRDALIRHWRRVLSREDIRGLRVEDLQVMTIAAAIAQHGPPPTRLGELPSDAVVAIIRWNRAQLIAVLAFRDDRWRIVAVTD